MAITALQTPPVLIAGYAPSYYTCTSSYSGQTGFKYMFQLTTENGTIEKKMYPLKDGLGLLDVSTLLKNYLSYELKYNSGSTTDSGLTDTRNSLKLYSLQIGHTGSTNTAGYGSPDIKFVLNCTTYDYNIYLNFQFDSYLFTNTTKKFLTNSPTTINVYPSDYYTLTGLNSNETGIVSLMKYIRIIVYYSTGASKTYNVTNPDYGHTPTAYSYENVDMMLKTFGCGPANLNSGNGYKNSISGLEETGIIPSNTTHYTIQVFNTTPTAISKLYTFVIKTDEPRYEKSQVAFLNRLGNFSYFTFIGKTRNYLNQDKSTYLKNRYGYDNNIGSSYWATDISKGGTKVFDNDITESITLVSDYIDQDTFDFMEELFTSPAVYLITSLGAIPLVITDTDWEKKKILNDKVINFTIKAEYSNKKIINV